MALSIPKLATELQTEADAYKLLEDLRWGDRPWCPHCGSFEPYFLTPKDGSSRKTRTGSKSQRRVWKCRNCRRQFSVLTGTIFHGSKIPVRTWVMVVFEMCASKNGVAAREIERKYGLTPKSAWFMLHRVREAMKREPMAGLLSGRVVVDETWIGSKPANRHGHNPKHYLQAGTDKTPVVSLVSRETGEVRSRAIPNVTPATLRSVIHEEVDAALTHLHTDGNWRYRRFADDFASHTQVDHQARQWVIAGATTNQAENYFSQLKRSIGGTHHHVSVEHLPRYLAEFDFRFNTCKNTDTERMGKLMKQTERRLTYREPGGDLTADSFWG